MIGFVREDCKHFVRFGTYCSMNYEPCEGKGKTTCVECDEFDYLNTGVICSRGGRSHGVRVEHCETCRFYSSDTLGQ